MNLESTATIMSQIPSETDFEATSSEVSDIYVPYIEIVCSLSINNLESTK